MGGIARVESIPFAEPIRSRPSHRFLEECLLVSTRRVCYANLQHSGFNAWLPSVTKKIAAASRSFSSHTLGTSGDFYDSFLRVLIPDVSLEGGDSRLDAKVRSFVNEDDYMPLKRVFSLLHSFKTSGVGGTHPSTLSVKLVVLPNTLNSDVFAVRRFLSYCLPSPFPDYDTPFICSCSSLCDLALLIGPVLLLWNSHSLLVPQLYHPMVLDCLLDLKLEVPLCQDTLLRVADMCCLFNKYFVQTESFEGSFDRMRSVDPTLTPVSSHELVWLFLQEAFAFEIPFLVGGPIDSYLLRILREKKALVAAGSRVHNECYTMTTLEQVEEGIRMLDERREAEKRFRDEVEEENLMLLKGFREGIFSTMEYWREKRRRRRQFECIQK